MKRLQLLTGGAIALAVANLFSACDRGPTRPTPGVNQGVPVTITDLQLAGPDSIPPGENAQFTATAFFSDGSSRTVTNEATWRSENPSVLSISPTGLATGHEPGEVSVSVMFGGGTSVKDEVLVVPAGTYRLIGAVRDAGVPVFGARVEVMAGTARGLAVPANGTYRLYGVSGDTEVRVTRDGYHEQKKSVQIISNQTLDFDLILSRPRDEVTGTYTLTVTVTAECRSLLPEAAMVRTYTAALRQDGPQLTVTLEGSKFFVERGRTLNSFRGIVEPNRVTFQLRSFDDYYDDVLPDLLEVLAPPTLLAVSGSAVTTVSPSGLSGTLNGPVQTLQSIGSGSYRKIATCFSAGHRFVLSR